MRYNDNIMWLTDEFYPVPTRIIRPIVYNNNRSVLCFVGSQTFFSFIFFFLRAGGKRIGKGPSVKTPEETRNYYTR